MNFEKNVQDSASFSKERIKRNSFPILQKGSFISPKLKDGTAELRSHRQWLGREMRT